MLQYGDMKFKCKTLPDDFIDGENCKVIYKTKKVIEGRIICNDLAKNIYENRRKDIEWEFASSFATTTFRGEAYQYRIK